MSCIGGKHNNGCQTTRDTSGRTSAIMLERVDSTKKHERQAHDCHSVRAHHTAVHVCAVEWGSCKPGVKMEGA